MSSSISLNDLQTPVTRESVRQVLLSMLTILEFPVEAWEDEGAARAFVELQSALAAEQSKSTAAIATGMFQSTATGDFLTARVKSDVDEDRNEGTIARISCILVNTGTSNYTKDAGAISFRASNGKVFKNVAGFTLSGGATLDAEQFDADSIGADGNISGSEDEPQILPLTTPLAGVTVRYEGTLITAGADAEKDPALRERARTKWSTLRVERIDDAIKNLVRTAAPAVVGVSIDSENPRGAGTVDVFLAAQNAPAGSGDVADAQVALDANFFGNGSEDQLVQAFAAVAAPLNLAVVAYVRGTTDSDALALLGAAWMDFVESIPVGGFDLSPGPTHTVLTEQIATALSQVAGVDSVQVVAPAGATSVAPNGKVTEGTVSITIVRLAATV